jgi:hypothetical protein
VKDCGEIVGWCRVVFCAMSPLLLSIGRSLSVVLCVRYVTLTLRIALVFKFLDLQTLFIRIFILRLFKLQRLLFTNGNDLCRPRFLFYFMIWRGLLSLRAVWWRSKALRGRYAPGIHWWLADFLFLRSGLQVLKFQLKNATECRQVAE